MFVALNRDKIPLDKLRKSPVFVAGELQKRYFTIMATVRFTPDWLYDDFKLKNTSFFTLHNAVIEVTAKQGDRSEHVSTRVAELAPEAEIELLELNVAAEGGEVSVQGTITADEGKVSWSQRL
ncbi:MAG TPA: hypothetical protein VEX18_04580 [Polyangiaceae bacterium]|nr:hypothetical protein [Polyangiaceae bacterium]